jgi:hypothetical protein
MANCAGSAAAALVEVMVLGAGVAVGEPPFGAATAPMRGTDGTVVGAELAVVGAPLAVGGAAATGAPAGVMLTMKLLVTYRSTAKPINALNSATAISDAATPRRRGAGSGCAAGGGC